MTRELKKGIITTPTRGKTKKKIGISSTMTGIDGAMPEKNITHNWVNLNPKFMECTFLI